MSRLSLRAAVAVVLSGFAGAAAALDIAGLDKSVDACTDFYQFTNRKWIDATTIPADRARWSTMDIMGQRNEKLLLEAIEAEVKAPVAKKRYKPGEPQYMALRYYQSGMNANRIAYSSYEPLLPMYERVKTVAAPADLARTLGYLHTWGIPAGFNFEVDADRKDSTVYLAEVTQGGLGIGDRDYYFLEDERTKGLREGYRKHVTHMFELLGDKHDVAGANAATVIALETELARASMTATERRDIDKTYNKMTLAQLTELAPGLPWADYFKELGAPGLAELNVAQPAFFKKLGELAASRPAAEWQTYLRWQLIHAGATKLEPKFEDEHFDFYERQFKGVQTPPPRHRRVLGIVGGPYGSQGVGMGLGMVFVDKNFPPEAKVRAQAMIDNVKAALRQRLTRADWMTEETRKRSLEKLDTMQVKIGYPDKWRDFKGVMIGHGNFLENWLLSNQLDVKRDLGRIGKPVDRSEWFMAPYVVNAYYNPPGNEIVFPASILQPPYFDMAADDASNYGGIGMVIGHEITHGFDNRGRRFDKNGNMTDWWTAEDERRYNARAEHIERQYSSFEGVEGVKPNAQMRLKQDEEGTI